MARSNSADKAESGAAKPATLAAPDMKFEAALAELEQIVQGMEGGRLPLEESLAAYRRGSELLKHCQQQLSEAERKIQILEDGVLRDFDVAAGRAP
jgi:exodeoxyribonuclease VII small subunit